jgi:hypothetical protein
MAITTTLPILKHMVASRLALSLKHLPQNLIQDNVMMMEWAPL